MNQDDLPKDVRIIAKSVQSPRAVHLFVREKAVLGRHLEDLRKRLETKGFLRMSWPKKVSKVETDITEDVILDIALPLGFVDVKACAVSDVWSALKLVIRKSERAA